MGRTNEPAASDVHPQHVGPHDDAPLSHPHGGSRYHTPLNEQDFAALDQNYAYSTPKAEPQPASGEFGGDFNIAPGDSLAIELHQGSLVRPPYTPEETPPSGRDAADSIATRSGRNIRKAPSHPTISTRGQSRVQKNKQKRPGTSASVALNEPLSKIASRFPNAKIQDIAAFVVRSTEQRQKEVAESASKKVKRPLNNFMLYRKAYQDVSKAWFVSQRHQWVSSASGTSWRHLESDELKQKFTDWALEEKHNHQAAFPGYKYSPNANKTKGDEHNATVTRADKSRMARESSTRANPQAGQAPSVYNAIPLGVELQSRELGASGPEMSYESMPYYNQQPLQPYAAIPGPYDQGLAYPHLSYYMNDGFLGNTQAQPNVSAYIDPQLVNPQTQQPFDGLSREQSLEQPHGGPFATTDTGQGMGFAALPDLDKNGADNAYLQGEGEWHVVPWDGDEGSLEQPGAEFSHSNHFSEAVYDGDYHEWP